jgi:hypothetical protein
MAGLERTTAPPATDRPADDNDNPPFRNFSEGIWGRSPQDRQKGKAPARPKRGVLATTLEV